MIKVKELAIALLPVPLHQWLVKVASEFLGARHLRTGAQPVGCAMIIRDDQGRVLLVRHSYVEPNTWMLPAGHIGRSENPAVAGAREVREEAHIEGRDMGMIEFEDTEYWGYKFRTFIVGGRASRTVWPDGREILAAKFFSPDALPEDSSLATVERIKRWRFRRSLPIAVPSFVRPEYVASERFSRRRQSSRC